MHVRATGVAHEELGLCHTAKGRFLISTILNDDIYSPIALLLHWKAPAD